MLKEASDYTHVDVSNISVAGDILPARDRSGNGAWRALKAEDASYLAEMACERDSGMLQYFSNTGYGPPSIRLNWQTWMACVVDYLKNAFYISTSRPNSGRGVLVEPEYVFEPKYGISANDKLRDMYPSAIGFSPSMDYETAYGWGAGNPFVLGAGTVRKMFYDMSRLVRFRGGSVGVSGSTTTTYDYLNWPTDGSSDTHTVSQGSIVEWGISMHGFEDWWRSVTKTTIDSAACTASLPYNLWVEDSVSEVVAFVRIETFISGDGPDSSIGDHYYDVMPVSCVKSGGVWSAPADFITNSVAEAAIRRHGGDPTAPTLTRPPFDLTGLQYHEKAMSVTFDSLDVVYLCKFPSDFSELGWGWEP